MGPKTKEIFNEYSVVIIMEKQEKIAFQVVLCLGRKVFHI